jgi:hypothetical protein
MNTDTNWMLVEYIYEYGHILKIKLKYHTYYQKNIV